MDSVQKILTAFVFALIVAAPTVSFAAMTRVSLVGAGTFDTPTSSNGDAYTSKTGLGGGILLGFPITMRTELEIGGLYITRKTDDTTAGFTIQANAIQVPVLLRFYLGRMLSIGVGGYAAFGMGNVTDTSDSSGAVATYTYADAQTKTTDYGALGSIALRLPLKPGFAILLDGRYAYGLSNVSEIPGLSLKYRDIQALAGFQFGM